MLSLFSSLSFSSLLVHDIFLSHMPPSRGEVFGQYCSGGWLSLFHLQIEHLQPRGSPASPRIALGARHKERLSVILSLRGLLVTAIETPPVGLD